MDEQHRKAYLNLIQALLSCTGGEEVNILLNANQDLIDTDLVQTMEQVAAMLDEQGDQNSADWLQSVAAQLATAIGDSTSTRTPEENLNFLLEVLQATLETEGDPQVVYPHLQANLEKLDDRFAQLLQNWAAATLPEEPQDQRPTIAAVLVNFSNLIAQFPLGNRASNLEIAIAGYRSALQVYTRTDFSVGWAAIQNNLGIVYSERIREDRAQNLEQAIHCYKQALLELTRERVPLDWATTQNNLGNAYRERIREDRAQSLEQAIHCYKQALLERTRERVPLDWAATQNNLGAAYGERIREDRAQNLEQAIDCFKQALLERTRERVPLDWAATQNNLGAVYGERIREDRAQNLEQAIDCFKQALLERTRERVPLAWAATQNNLGTTYCKHIREDGDQGDTTEAIDCYKQALLEYTRERVPLDWATTQNNLGNAYLDQGHTTEAIDCYKQALLERTRERVPLDWAMTQNNLGNAYRDQGHTTEAIQAFQSALEIHTPISFPLECLRAGRNLGNTAFTARWWTKAIEGYRAAIDAVEQSRAWAVSESRRQEILEQAINVYQKMVQACINNEQLNWAIEYAERSKARNLVELLATRDLYPKGEIPEAVLNKLERLRQEIPAKQRLLWNNPSDSTHLEQAQQELSNLHQQLDDLITQHIKPIDPSFSLTQKVEPINFKQIQALLPDDKTAILQWYILGETFLTFIITHHQRPIVHQSSPEEQKALFTWANEYLRSYYQVKFQWQSDLSKRLQHLAEILHLDKILSEPIFKTCKQLILIPHRFLHLLPLHALPLPEDPQKCLLDIFPKGVQYAPSCQVLQLCQNQQRPKFSHFFAIQNPTQDLSYTDIEVTTIRRNFQPNDDVLSGQEARKVAISLKPVYQAHCAHFSCHGYFNFESPLQSALLLADSEISPAPDDPDPGHYLPLRNGAAIDLSKCLTLDDLFSQTFDLGQCRLVTLSACETGMTDFTSFSDEYVGLPSGFLYAGSTSVVSSLWAVNDLSTAILIIKFYQNLEADLTISAALNSAQLWLRQVTKEELQARVSQLPLDDPLQEFEIESFVDNLEAHDRPFASPYHWAAFCAIGQ